MGFMDHRANVAALDRTKGNVNGAIDLLINQAEDLVTGPVDGTEEQGEEVKK
jgi:hypothetical protein